MNPDLGACRTGPECGPIRRSRLHAGCNAADHVHRVPKLSGHAKAARRIRMGGMTPRPHILPPIILISVQPETAAADSQPSPELAVAAADPLRAPGDHGAIGGAFLLHLNGSPVRAATTVRDQNFQENLPLAA
jgi:hypothetical protein